MPTPRRRDCHTSDLLACGNQVILRDSRIVSGMPYRLKPLLFVVLAFASSSDVRGNSVLTPWQPLFKGIEHAIGTNFPNTVFIGSTGPYTNTTLQVMHCLRIDLGDPDVQLLASPPAPNPVFDSRETLTYSITSFILSNRVQVAVNAD